MSGGGAGDAAAAHTYATDVGLGGGFQPVQGVLLSTLFAYIVLFGPLIGGALLPLQRGCFNVIDVAGLLAGAQRNSSTIS